MVKSGGSRSTAYRVDRAAVNLLIKRSQRSATNAYGLDPIMGVNGKLCQSMAQYNTGCDSLTACGLVGV